MKISPPKFYELIAVLGCFCCQQKTALTVSDAGELPYLSTKIDTVYYEGTKKVDTFSYSRIPQFRLINQDSVIVTDQIIKNKVVLAEFFFTSCPSICPLVSKQLSKVYTTYKSSNNFIILSYTINSEYDTPEVLKSYANDLGVNTSNWQFLTGDSKQIYDLANFGYKTTVYNDPDIDGIDGLMHSGILVLVDKNQIIRGLYDGKDKQDTDRLIKDINVLINTKEAI